MGTLHDHNPSRSVDGSRKVGLSGLSTFEYCDSIVWVSGGHLASFYLRDHFGRPAKPRVTVTQKVS